MSQVNNKLLTEYIPQYPSLKFHVDTTAVVYFLGDYIYI